MSVVDQYRVLGVNQNASLDEIRRAWRNAVRQAHPDHAASDIERADRTRRTAELNVAYGVLSDAGQRARLDLDLETAHPPRPPEGDHPASPANAAGRGWADVAPEGWQEAYAADVAARYGVAPARRRFDTRHTSRLWLWLQVIVAWSLINFLVPLGMVTDSSRSTTAYIVAALLMIAQAALGAGMRSPLGDSLRLAALLLRFLVRVLDPFERHPRH